MRWRYQLQSCGLPSGGFFMPRNPLPAPSACITQQTQKSAEDDMGHLFKRGNVYWIKYYRNGKPYRESTKSKKEADAKRLLKRREGEISEGKLPGVYFDRVRFDELAEGFLADYRINGKRSLVRAERSVRTPEDFLRRVSRHRHHQPRHSEIHREAARTEGRQRYNQPGACRPEAHAQSGRQADSAQGRTRAIHPHAP